MPVWTAAVMRGLDGWKYPPFREQYFEQTDVANTISQKKPGMATELID